ncbi:TIGR01212 family radical SAM protein [Algivirga pacifica]|uniref:TIGR01212 family radical SAM protein n=1 Tax=Algivirga pacifica TaxID=1162670 RepID=A0ABP9DBI3_9BACT
MIHEQTEEVAYAWGHSKRYNSQSVYLKNTYGGRVQKVSIAADFTCPNRDGSLGWGGCTFCNNESFIPSYTKGLDSITAQLDKGLTFLKKRYKRSAMFVGYFQSYSNTYGSLEKIKEIYQEALAHPDISGLVIGTRPDCITNEQLDYLQELAKTHYIDLEFGIEATQDAVLETINRGHDFATSVDAIHRAAGRGFELGAHMLFGLPNQSREAMLAQVHDINRLPINTIKFHQLQIVKGTIMAKQYKTDPTQFHLFDQEEYIEFVIDFMERLRPDITVQRLFSEAPPSIKIAPHWGNARMDVLQQKVEERMEERDTWQGKLL